jgi:hypothetical protein
VVLFAYWLGGDVGVFVCSRYVTRADLPLPERLRFLDALMTIDIMPRTAIVLLPLVGTELAAIRGAIRVPEAFRVALWIAGLAWLALVWTVFGLRGTPRALPLQRIDVGLRLVLIAARLGIAAVSLRRCSPVHEGWLAAKLAVYAALLGIGLYLRTVILTWRGGFVRLRAGEAAEAVDPLFRASLRRGNYVALLFWSLIVTMAWLGINKPFWAFGRQPYDSQCALAPRIDLGDEEHLHAAHNGA